MDEELTHTEPLVEPRDVKSVDDLKMSSPNESTRAGHEKEKKNKRLLDDAISQYIEFGASDEYTSFSQDPWVNPSAITPIKSKFPDNEIEILIIGAGWGGIQYAVRMIQAGIRPQNIRIVDIAGGFGGFWYWNRYPGLVCDIESLSYLPFLGEMKYLPFHRYSHGREVLAYANMVVDKFKLVDCGVFQTEAQKLIWDEDDKVWLVDLLQLRENEPPRPLEITAKFVCLAPGLLGSPQLPDIPGILDFKGDLFHSSRWRYDITGGSCNDKALYKLKDKKVAIIGTGASAVQIIPGLARWCEHLFVIQRTPAAVDQRDQMNGSEWWLRQLKWQSSNDWQRERLRNFHAHFTLGEKPEIDLVDDGWTHAPGLIALTGNPTGPKVPSQIPRYIQKLGKIDEARRNRIRSRVDREVNDPVTAEKLKPWHPSWYKRPLFNDEYLQTFNRENVTLVDTDGKGVDMITRGSIVAGGKEYLTLYKVDIIILATGHRTSEGESPADKSNITIIGRDGASMSKEWRRVGPTTLHGILDTKFPNLFLSGPCQGCTSMNDHFSLDEFAKHAAYILSESKRRAKGRPFAVAPTPEAAENWAIEIMKRSPAMATVAACRPGYFSHEDMHTCLSAEQQVIAARSGIWGWGMEDWISVIEKWRDEGSMDGIEVRVE